MTYCVAMKLDSGMIFLSDSRTNAGVDHIATFQKMYFFSQPGERTIVMMSAGNLATTQSIVSLLNARTRDREHNMLTVRSMYEAAEMVGETMREIVARDAQGQQSQGVDFSCSLLIGGQIRGEDMRLFNIYPQGNFIEATTDTPYFQIGESKYGKPILDRALRSSTCLAEALKCGLISFDSTMKSNLSVGLPLDMAIYKANQLSLHLHQRFYEDDAYLMSLRQQWSEGLKNLLASIPPPAISGLE